MNVFYFPEIREGKVFLGPGESHHCIKVLRYDKGDMLRIIDGYGGYYTARIVDDNPKAVGINIIERHMEYQRLPYDLHIAIAPTKSKDRFEWFIEKAVEIGVSGIHPILCDRSERRTVRMDRLENIVVSAMKQSVKAYKPEIFSPLTYKEWIEKPRKGKKYIAHCNTGDKQNIWETGHSTAYHIMIGPEGDFTPEEVEHAADHGYESLSLGDFRLRTETAAIVACTTIYYNHKQ
ncbi:MAG: 16S rRNA (uracil(1498)-N(3))-methyltransferase [Bacteroidales bacterium]|nr:16S rRNA (uracil(1498)-N(3))-methyltransferase [Bacteroidales bacterium]